MEGGQILAFIRVVHSDFANTTYKTKGVPLINRRIHHRTKPNDLDLSTHVNFSFGFLTAHKKFVIVLNNV